MNGAIFRRLNSAQVAQLLAKFNGEPAIFYQKAPDDVQLIDGNYPQLVFQVDKFSDTIRGVSGLLTVDIICCQNSSTPEELEPLCRHALEGRFFAPVDAEIFMLKWQRTDAFSEPASERTPLIVGATVTFEIYEFPTAQTCAPDPIQALNLWTTRIFPEALTIGVSDFGDEFKPTRERAAIYFDAQLIRLLTLRPTAIFLQATINAHVFCDTVTARREWLSALHLALLRAGTFRLEDGSPLRLTESELNFAASEMQGQLKLTFEFAAEKHLPYAHPLAKTVSDFDGRLRYVHA